jgi:hypothetical protein
MSDLDTKKAELAGVIEVAIQEDADIVRYTDEREYSHSFSLKRLNLTDEQLSEMVERLDADKRVRTHVEALLTHRWTNGSESGYEEISDFHFIEVSREQIGKLDLLSIDAEYGAYWELIPPGSPGYLSDYSDPKGLVISIADLDPADVLLALYNAARPRGMGFLVYDPEPLSREEANKLLQEKQYFDYVKGRVMKVRFGNGAVEAKWYDHANGPGTAQQVIRELRRTKQPTSPVIREIHEFGKLEAAGDAHEYMGEELRPAIDKALHSQRRSAS